MNELHEMLMKMKVGEKEALSCNDLFVRVPGGWIYGDLEGCCFIPLSEAKAEAEAIEKAEEKARILESIRKDGD